MKGILKIVAVVTLLFISFSSLAQSKEYLNAEKNRIETEQGIETELESFISYNMTQYELTSDLKEDIIYDLRQEGILSKEKIDKALLIRKKKELRKLYFQELSNKDMKYVENNIPYSQRLACINGDFETAVNLNYLFTSDPNASNVQCTVNSATPFIPTVNNFNALVTVMDNTDASWNQATMQFDPDLNSAEWGNIQVPTISPNGGNRSIKLNNSHLGILPGQDVTTMSRQVFVDDNTLDYEFSLLLQNSGHQGTNQEPIFTVRIFDLNNNLIQQRCILSQPDCNFLVAPSNLFANRDFYYTGWVCDQIDVSALNGTPVNANGMNAIVEFVIADCGQGGHSATVYIDNICGFTCNNPFLGIVSSNPINGNCPDFVNNTPYQICGNYNIPANSILNGLTISMSQDGGVTFTPINPANFTLNITTVDAQNGTYCFGITPTIFAANPTGTYIFEITETFTQNCVAGTFAVNNTTLATANFANCCQDNAVLASPLEDVNNLSQFVNTQNPLAVRHLERAQTITATNTIGVGDNTFQNGVVYHAGDCVILDPGFETISGAQFTAYPEGCTLPQNFVYRNATAKTENELTKKEVEVNLVKVSSDFSIVPNPSSDSVKISTDNIEFNHVIIVALDGRVILDKSISNTKHYDLNIHNYQNGIYLVKIITKDGQSITQKLIKK